MIKDTQKLMEEINDCCGLSGPLGLSRLIGVTAQYLFEAGEKDVAFQLATQALYCLADDYDSKS